jgi:hypothetical protein
MTAPSTAGAYPRANICVTWPAVMIIGEKLQYAYAREARVAAYGLTFRQMHRK